MNSSQGKTSIDNLTKNRLFGFKIGQAKVQVDKYNLIKIIDLAEIRNQFIKLNEAYIRIKYSTVNVTNDYFKITDLLHEKIDKMINQINPLYMTSTHQRNRRGLINIAGNLIKVITGNLDHDDAIMYDQKIKQLRQNQNKIQTVLNDHITLFQNTTNEIESKFQILLHNQKLIENALNGMIHLNNMNLKVNTPFYAQVIIQQIKDNFQLLYDTLEEFEVAITFAKMNVLHNTIINPEDLLNALKEAQPHFKSYKFFLEPTIENLLIIENSISIKGYIDKGNIVFILEVPLVKNDDFDLFRLYSIPSFNEQTNNFITVIPNNNFIVINDISYAFYDTVCRFMSNNLYLCEELTVIYPLYQPCCETNLLLNLNIENNLCIFHSVPLTSVHINHIDNNKWLISSPNKLQITEKCQNNLNNIFYLEGTNLLTIDKHCVLKFENFTLQTHSNNHMYYKNITLPQMMDLELPNIEMLNDVNVSQSKLSLKPINLKFNNIYEELNKQKTYLNSISSPVDLKKFDIYSLCLFLILVLIIGGFFLFKYLSKVPRTDLAPPNLPSQGGGVMFVNPTDLSHIISQTRVST